VQLRYTLPALADLNSILDYIAAHSPQGARRVRMRIQVMIDLLLMHPNIGTRTDDPVIRRSSSSMPSVTRRAILPGCPVRPDRSSTRAPSPRGGTATRR
jgi:plasmid stabilization system protein ParE